MTQQVDTQVERHYIRCTDCLSIGAVDGQYAAGWHCSICGGPIEHMGRVTQDQQHIETLSVRSACDRRCTHAVGPLCVCKCGCKNHGTGRVVTVAIIRDLPVVQFIPDDKALALATAYRQQLSDLQNVCGVWEAKRRDYSLPYNVRGQYQSYRLRRLIFDYVEARTHKSRETRLNKAQTLAQSVVNL